MVDIPVPDKLLQYFRSIFADPACAGFGVVIRIFWNEHMGQPSLPVGESEVPALLEGSLLFFSSLDTPDDFGFISVSIAISSSNELFQMFASLLFGSSLFSNDCFEFPVVLL
jgi:hypothetical protein